MQLFRYLGAESSLVVGSAVVQLDRILVYDQMKQRHLWMKSFSCHKKSPIVFFHGTPKGGLKCLFHAGILHKSRLEIVWNSCSRQVYPITLDARLTIHEITQFFSSNAHFHALKYFEQRHHAFPLGTPTICTGISIFLVEGFHFLNKQVFKVNILPARIDYATLVSLSRTYACQRIKFILDWWMIFLHSLMDDLYNFYIDDINFPSSIY